MANFRVLTWNESEKRTKQVASSSNAFDFGSVRIGASNLTISEDSGKFDFNAKILSNVAEPIVGTDAATKAYVDAVAQGIDVKAACRVATTANLDATYSNGTAGLGATLTANANGAITIDGVALDLNNRVLVKNQTDATHNGIYVVTTIGTAGTPFVLTRATDYDNNPAGEVHDGTFTFIAEGTLNVHTGWVMGTPGTVVFGSSNIEWTQFSSAGVVEGGAGLVKTGNILDVVASDNSIEVLADGIKVKLNSSDVIKVGAGGLYVDLSSAQPDLDNAGGKLTVKTGDGLDHSVNGVTVKLDGSTIAKGTNGVKVADAGISATQLATSVAGDGLSGGAGTPLAVNVGNGIEIVSDNVSVKSDATGGANLAKSISVSSNGVAVKVDNGSIGENASSQLEVKDAGITAAKIASSAIGSGLQGGSGTVISVATGDGIKIDESGNVSFDGAVEFSNASGTAIAEGDIVYVKNDGTIAKAQASIANLNRYMIGVAAVNIGNGSNGKVWIRRGSVIPSFYGTLTDGDKVYVSKSTAGGVTQNFSGGNALASGDFIYCIGRVMFGGFINLDPQFEIEW